MSLDLQRVAKWFERNWFHCFAVVIGPIVVIELLNLLSYYPVFRQETGNLVWSPPSLNAEASWLQTATTDLAIVLGVEPGSQQVNPPNPQHLIDSVRTRSGPGGYLESTVLDKLNYLLAAEVGDKSARRNWYDPSPQSGLSTTTYNLSKGRFIGDLGSQHTIIQAYVDRYKALLNRLAQVQEIPRVPETQLTPAWYVLFSAAVLAFLGYVVFVIPWKNLSSFSRLRVTLAYPTTAQDSPRDLLSAAAETYPLTAGGIHMANDSDDHAVLARMESDYGVTLPEFFDFPRIKDDAAKLANAGLLGKYLFLLRYRFQTKTELEFLAALEKCYTATGRTSEALYKLQRLEIEHQAYLAEKEAEIQEHRARSLASRVKIRDLTEQLTNPQPKLPKEPKPKLSVEDRIAQAEHRREQQLANARAKIHDPKILERREDEINRQWNQVINQLGLEDE